MKKIIIISYFYPPCNLTASQRSSFWGEYLFNFNIYPIVITKNWSNNIDNEEYNIENSFNKIIYLNKDNLIRKTLLKIKRKNILLKIIQKTFTLKDLLFIHFSNKIYPVNSFLKQTEKIIQTEKIDGIIISGAPFELFKVGYLINKKYGINWIADYRDDWSTNEVLEYSFIQKMLNKLNRKSEKKWISSSSAITSVSDHYTNKISLFNSKIGYTIENGFFDFIEKPHESNEKFILIYNGTLYKSQKIEDFMNAFINFCKNKENVQLKFIGAGFDQEQKIRLEKYLKVLKEKLIITSRVSKKEILDEQKKASILLMFSHNNCRGIPSSKLYEYFSFGKHILSTPKDNDIIDDKLAKYELGYSFDKTEEIENFLNKKYEEFINYKLKVIEAPEKNEFIKTQHRLNQTEKLADLLHKYF